MSKITRQKAEKSASERLFEIAESQAGYFTAKQAASAGVSRQLLSHHANNGGSLIRTRRGLYRMRQFPSSKMELLVAEWLHTGLPINAVVSHESAAELLDLTDLIPGKVHMTAPLRYTGRRTPSSVQLHFTTDGVPAGERTERNGIPVTAVERTIIDLLTSHGVTEQSELAVAQALDRELITVESLRRAAAGRSKAALGRVDQALESRQE